MENAKAAYLGFDCETTGLHPDEAILIEIGMVALDKDFNEISRWSSLVNAGDGSPISSRDDINISEYVKMMHTENGLWDSLENAAKNGLNTTPEFVEKQAIQWINDNNLSGLPMLGSSITLDREFLHNEMPLLLSMFHYRSVDATSFALVLDKTEGKKFTDYVDDSMESTHRVIGDILNSASLVKCAVKELKNS